MSLRTYHLAWLSVHPERTPEWLTDRLADGFHVHHVDGNHANDKPDNLVLIENLDHIRIIHGWTKLKKLGHNRVAGTKGGLNSRKFMTPAKARKLARKAARARWHPPQTVVDVIVIEPAPAAPNSAPMMAR